MAMLFDPRRFREVFEESLLDMALSTQDDHSPAMGNIAIELVGDVIDASLLGLETRIAPVLPRALEWLDRAIRVPEEFDTSPDFHRMRLLWAKAIGSWLQSGVRDPDAWEAVRVQSRAAAADPAAYAAEDLATLWLDDHMAFCVLAGKWPEGVAEYERHHGAAAPAIDLDLEPRALGYALCLHGLRGSFDAAQIARAGRRMLSAHLEETWLGGGHRLNAATWLDVICGSRLPAPSPLQTLLCAYEHMPRVTRPGFTLPLHASR